MIRHLGSTIAILMLGCSGAVASGTGTQGQPLDECQIGTTAACVQSDQSVGTKSCKPGDQGYVWGTCEPASCTANEQSCVTPGGEAGVTACRDGKTASACGVPGNCHPGETSPVCPGEPCRLMGDTWAFGTCGNGGGSTTSGTPLVVAFHGERVAFTHAQGAFDVFGRGVSLESSWVSAETPWLALDRNDNGSIDDGSELFGSMTELPTGTLASNGFIALAALDDDGDGFITPADGAFAKLLLWRDRDQDRRSSPSEIEHAADAGLVSIALDYHIAPRCNDGDCEIERARFEFRDDGGVEHTGEVVDVHFTAR